MPFVVHVFNACPQNLMISVSLAFLLVRWGSFEMNSSSNNSIAVHVMTMHHTIKWEEARVISKEPRLKLTLMSKRHSSQTIKIRHRHHLYSSIRKSSYFVSEWLKLYLLLIIIIGGCDL